MAKSPIIDVWIHNELIIPNCRPTPILMHTSPRENQEEVSFWNDLRDFLEPKIKVNYFNHIEEAGEIVVTPHILRNYKNYGTLKQVIATNKQIVKSGRKVVTFTGGPDYESLDGEIVFSASSYKTTKDAIFTPLWLYDLGMKPKIPKPEIPTVAFVAQAFYPGKLSDFIGKLPTPIMLENYLAGNQSLNRLLPLNGTQSIARLVRQRVYQCLKKSEKLDLELRILKKGFFSHTDEEKKVLKKRFLDSIKNNIYNICVRGDSNCIHQLYEFMSSGRIPVFIDTNSQLPELRGMKWEDFCIVVPFKDVEKIEDYILEFHHNHTEEQLWEKFAMARKAFEQLLPKEFVEHYVMPKLKIDREEIGEN